MGVIHFVVYQIGAYFEFPFNTHKIDGGMVSDCDSPPTYRVYEAGTDTVVMTGTCAKKDDANTVGFYVARGQVTEEDGFATGRDYELRVEATVDAITQADIVGIFRVEYPTGIPPLSGELCRLYAYMYYLDGVNAGKPVGAGLGSLEVVDLLTRPSGGLIIYGESGNKGLTDANGHAQVDVVRGARLRLRASWPVVKEDGSGDTQYAYADVTVPDEATLDVGALFQS
jgi:hypothetical protein